MDNKWMRLKNKMNEEIQDKLNDINNTTNLIKNSEITESTAQLIVKCNMLKAQVKELELMKGYMEMYEEE